MRAGIDLGINRFIALRLASTLTEVNLRVRSGKRPGARWIRCGKSLPRLFRERPPPISRTFVLESEAVGRLTHRFTPSA
jgi:hypothetical protein